MRFSPGRAALALFASVMMLSCSDTPIAPAVQTPTPVNHDVVAMSLPSVRISEFHYDNTGTDSGERVEVSGPAGTDLAGWSLVFYNGSTPSAAVVYRTTALSGIIPATCDTRGVLVFALPTDGIQNGPTDGFALVDNTGGVVELLSYEGTITASTGPAAGMTSVDIGVFQSGSEPVGSSLQRNGAGVWFETEGSNTFGACNDHEDVEPPVVDHVVVEPATASIGAGATQQFTATAYEAGPQVIPGVVFTWTSDNEAVATVSAAGLATGGQAGTATITATAPNGEFDSAVLTVTAPSSGGDVVISQVYGGGGNSGATYTHDFVELFNRGSQPADISGWRIHYGASASSSWTATTITTGTIAPGRYFLVQFASGGSNGVALPASNATGTTNLAAGAGKVLLSRPAATFGDACPDDALIVDRVSFGSTNCSSSWGSTGTLSASLAALRKNDGCTKSGVVSDDFVTGTPMPRNNSNPQHSCDAVTGIVRISEIHYDNVGTDAGEAIEIEAPAGANLSGWQVVLYNGNGGVTYGTSSITQTVGATCGDRGVITINFGANGLQNGSPDGVALVNSANQVVEFLSYEGTFTATNGPASGMESTDIGVSEHPDNSVPAGYSLQRDADGNWYGPEVSSFGACNARPPQSAATIVINEVMADPLRAPGGQSWGEWFEVYNYGASAVDLQGWTITSFGQPNHVIASSVVVPAGGFAVLGRGFDPEQNGGLTIDYNYFTGSSTTIIFDAIDRVEVLDGAGVRVDMVRWTSVPRGVTRALRAHSLDNEDMNGAAWGYSTTPFGDGDFGTPGAPNGELSDTPPPSPPFLTFTGRTSADAPLPVGFEDQLFATLNDPNGGTIPTTITWTSETPGIATVDARGVMRALSAGTAVLRATATDGTTRTHALATVVATASTTAQYGNHAEFGEPTDADPSDDFLVRRTEFTSSWNGNRGIPNWVAYNLEATHIVSGEDRCDCFTFDPEVEAAGFARYNTADYTGAGAFHGYGIDRGHLARSFDRTSGALDNARTFYFSNIIPQAADNNQGPWAVFENYLGDRARFDNKEVYIIAGASGSKGTVKNEGLMTIPAQTWKVGVIMPRDNGLGDVVDYRDLEVIAVIMPNDPGIRNVDWNTYRTTVDAVEALSGYDLLALLPDNIERAIESATQPPIAKHGGPYTATEGSPVALNGTASLDPNGTITSYHWILGDGSTATGSTVSHTYAVAGVYTVKLIVTDNDALVDTATTTVTVGALPLEQRAQYAITLVNQLVTNGIISAGIGNSLTSKIQAALSQIQKDKPGSLQQLNAALNELNALVNAGQVAAADVAAVKALLLGMIATLAA